MEGGWYAWEMAVWYVLAVAQLAEPRWTGNTRSDTSRSFDTARIIKVSRERPIILQAYH